MEVPSRGPEEKPTFTVLVTGANSGLGFAICCRLIDEFLLIRPQSQTLHLLYSTRDVPKSEDTSRRLHVHLQKTLREANGRTLGISLLLEGRVKIEGVLVDLTKLITVKTLAEDLLRRGEVLDAVICNAGVAGWKGTDYLKGIWHILTNLIHATTYPEFMIPDVGLVAKPQSSDQRLQYATQPSANSMEKGEPKLGQVFLANVFGHYMLTHWLAPLFTPSSRIIWISSISTLPSSFNVDDIQGLNAYTAYESSKRLTDLLVLTSELPSTNPYVRNFLAPAPQQPQQDIKAHAQQIPLPKMYVTHPGVIATSMSNQNWFMAFWMVAALYLARWLSSPWHPVDPYKGAISAVFCALSPASQLPSLEEQDGKGKWGSATGVYGDERVARTKVEGWGYCGFVGRMPAGSVTGSTGSYKGKRETDREMREGFEEDARRMWREMEELREEWEKRLGSARLEVAKDI